MSGSEEGRRPPTLAKAVEIINDCIAELEFRGLRVTGERHDRSKRVYRVQFELENLVLGVPVPQNAVCDYRDGGNGCLRSIVRKASQKLHRRKSAGR